MPQSVDSDAELADHLVEEHGEAAAEEEFDEMAKGEQVDKARHENSIDPESGEADYQPSKSGHAADADER